MIVVHAIQQSPRPHAPPKDPRQVNLPNIQPCAPPEDQQRVHLHDPHKPALRQLLRNRARQHGSRHLPRPPSLQATFQPHHRRITLQYPYHPHLVHLRLHQLICHHLPLLHFLPQPHQTSPLLLLPKHPYHQLLTQSSAQLSPLHPFHHHHSQDRSPELCLAF